MTKEIDPCSVCGTTPQLKRITYTQTIGDKLYVVKDLPAQVCPRCGEEYLDPDMVDAIQEIIEKHQSVKQIQVPVVRFQSNIASITKTTKLINNWFRLLNQANYYITVN